MIFELTNPLFQFPASIFPSFFPLIDTIFPALIAASMLCILWLLLSPSEEAAGSPSAGSSAFFLKPVVAPALQHYGIAALAALTFFVGCSAFWGLTDEVMINLKHVYNLYHFKHFSMAPDSMVDGTVEYVFYLLHMPFGGSEKFLVLGNYIVSMLCGLAIFSVIWLGPFVEDRRLRLFVAILASVFPPLLFPVASGFGNSLVTVFFLLALAAFLRERWLLGALCCFLIPAIRPDGLLWAFVVIGGVFLQRWMEGRLNRIELLRLVLAGVAALLGLFAFGVATLLLYGHWVPTPIYFKSVSVSLFWSEPGTIIKGLARALTRDIPAGSILILVATIFVLKAGLEKYRALLVQRPVNLLLATAALSALFAAAYVAASSSSNWYGNEQNRYGMNFPIVLLILLGAALIPMMRLHSRRVAEVTIAAIGAVFALMMLVRSVAPPAWHNLLVGTGTNRTWAYNGGALAQAIVQPTTMSVATTEMATFSMAVRDRYVLDYWGYTNPAIAKSKLCSGDQTRVNPDEFLRAKPDVFWSYWFTATQGEYNYDSVEHAYAFFHHTSRAGNRLGDMMAVFAAYDVYLLRIRDMTYSFLVRKDRRSELQGRLSQLGFRDARSRPIDMNAFTTLYNSVPVVLNRC